MVCSIGYKIVDLYSNALSTFDLLHLYMHSIVLSVLLSNNHHHRISAGYPPIFDPLVTFGHPFCF